MTRANERRPAGAASEADGPARIVPRHGRPRPDLWLTYPDPSVNFRPTMYGLPIEHYRAEWLRRRDEGWQRWELERRLPAPGAVSA